MGAVINFLKELSERIAKGNKLKLYIGGSIITFIVVLLSGSIGWLIERLFLFFELKISIISTLLFTFVLSSSLASRSLNKSIIEIGPRTKTVTAWTVNVMNIFLKSGINYIKNTVQ